MSSLNIHPTALVRRLRQPTTSDWMIWFEDWIALLETGISVLESLRLSQEILQSQNSKHPLSSILQDTLKRAEQGETLVQALSAQTQTIPSDIVLTLECGQQTGQLASTGKRHLEQWKNRLQAQKELIKSLIYPVCVLIAATGCWWLLQTQSITPQPDLNPSPSSQITLEDWVLFGGLGCLALCLPLLAVKKLRSTSQQAGLLRGLSPISAWYTSQFFFSLEQELAAGYDLLYCLRHRHQSKHTHFPGSKRLHAKLNQMNARTHQAIKEGQPFSQALRAARAPDFMIRQAMLAEQTGEIHQTYGTAAKLFELEAKKRQRYLHRALGPVTLLIAAITLLMSYQFFIAPIYDTLGAF